MEREASILPGLHRQELQAHLLGPGLNPDSDINSVPVKAIPAIHKKMYLNYKHQPRLYWNPV